MSRKENELLGVEDDVLEQATGRKPQRPPLNKQKAAEGMAKAAAVALLAAPLLGCSASKASDAGSVDASGGRRPSAGSSSSASGSSSGGARAGPPPGARPRPAGGKTR